MVRSPTDLLELPYSFTQLRPLVASSFVREAGARGVSITEAQLEGLHRFRLLTPLLRVRRDGRAIAVAARRGTSADASQLAHWQPTNRWDLLRARDEKRLYAAADEPFVARERLARRVGEIDYSSSDYLYSHHQLLRLPMVEQALPFFRYERRSRRPRVVGLDVNRFWRSFQRDRAKQYDATVVLISALEPIYYPQIVRRLSLLTDREFDDYDAWRRELPIESMLQWLGISAVELKDVAGALLQAAENFDPLGEWLTVVREATPERWAQLRGTARNAIDYRIAAEILLRYYDDLAREGLAEPIEQPKPGWGQDHTFQRRLKPQGGLDRILTDFDLSPHPSLLLVVEGATELLIFPRLMRLLGVRTDEDFISIQNAEGVKRDISTLVSYVIAPRIDGPVSQDRYLSLLRPLARVLVVTDPEGPMEDARQRKRRREVWIERILRTFPQEHRTAAVRDAIDRLVYVETWDRHGQSFEFANFTDHQLARAIDAVDTRKRQPSMARRVELVRDARDRRGRLDDLGVGSKTDLAEELWPVLKRKVQLAERRGTVERIPIVRVLDRATDLAREFPRRNVVIPLRERNTD
jgi:hypothetical protein